MAISSTTVVYNLVGKDNASRAMDSVGKSADKLEKNIGRVGSAVKKTAALIGIAGIAELGAHTLKAAADYQSSMTLLVTAGGENKKALGLVSQGIMDIATSTGTSTKQLAEGMYTVEKAGFRGANGLNVLKVSAQAAKAENVDLSVMTNAVTSAMTSYHVPASKAVVITNEMVAAAGAAKTTMSNYAGALSTVLPIASAAGISFAQVGGAIATLTNHGTSAEEATQELANTIRNLQAPNNVAVNEMAQLGISSNDVATKLGKRGLTGTLEYLSETVLKKMGKSGTVLLNTFNASKIAATDANTMFAALPPRAQKVAKAYENGSLSLKDYRNALKALPADQASLAMQWATTENKAKGFNSALRAGGQPAQTYTAAIKAMTGGATGLNTTLQLTGENTGRFNANVNAVSEASKHAGSNISTWAKTQQTFNVKWDRFREGIEVAGIKIGNLMLGPMTSFIGFLDDKVGPKVATAGGKIGGIFHDLSPAASGAGSVVTTFFTKVVEPGAHKAAAAVSGIFGGISPSLSSTSTDVGDFLNGLSGKHFKPKGRATTVQQIVDVQTGIDPTAAAKAGKKIHDTIQGLFNGSIKINPGKLGATIGSAVFAAIGWLATNAEKLTGALIKAMAGIDWLGIGGEVGKQAVPFVVGFIANLFDPVTIYDSIKKHPLDWAEAIISLLAVGKAGSAIAKVLEKIPILRWFAPLFRGLETITKPINDALGKVAGAIGGGLKDAFIHVFPDAAKWIGEHTGGYLSTAIGSKAIDLSRAAGRLGDGLLGGIRGWSKQLGVEILSVTRDIIRPFAKAGSWLVRGGADAMGGLLRGIGSGFGAVGRWLAGIGSRLLSPFRGIGSWLVGDGTDLLAGLYTGITRRWTTVWRWLSGLPSRIGGAALGWASALTSKGGALIQGLFDGIASKMAGVASWIKSVVIDPIIKAVKDFFGIASPSKVFAEIGGHLITGLMKGMATTNGTAIARKIFGDMPSALAALVNKGMVDVAGLPKKAIDALQNVTGLGVTTIGGSGSPGVAAYAPMILRALSMLGQSSRWLPIVEQRMNQESGGNSTIVNTWDSNWLAGHPSVGLMQVIKGTFDAFAGPFKNIGPFLYGVSTNALANIYAGLNYAIHRYGTLSALLRPGGYAKGGSPPAGTLAWVGEEGPELVLFKGAAQVYPHSKSMEMARGRDIAGFAKGGAVNSGTRDAGKSYVSHLKAEIKLSSSNTDIQHFVDQLIDRIRHTKYSKAQSDFLINYVQAAGDAAVKSQKDDRLSVGKKLVDSIRAAFTDNRSISGIQAATQNIVSRIEQAFTGQQKSGLVGYTERVNDQMTRLATARDRIASKLAAANELSTSVASGAEGLADISTFTSLGSNNLLKEFHSKLAAINKFSSNIATMKRHGFSSELIAELLAAGIDQAAPIAAQLAKAPPAQVHQFNATQRAVDRAASKLGTVAVNAQFGKSAAHSFVASLRSQEASLEKQMRQLAKVFARGIGRAFHLKGYWSGGHPAPGELAIVGERGPEIIHAGSSGATVIPLTGAAPSGETAAMRRELAEIKKLLGVYLAAGHVTSVQIDRKELVRQVEKQQKLNAGRGRVA